MAKHFEQLRSEKSCTKPLDAIATPASLIVDAAALGDGIISHEVTVGWVVAEYAKLFRVNAVIRFVDVYSREIGCELLCAIWLDV